MHTFERRTHIRKDDSTFDTFLVMFRTSAYVKIVAECDDINDAMAIVNYLNGGPGDVPVIGFKSAHAT